MLKLSGTQEELKKAVALSPDPVSLSNGACIMEKRMV